MAGLCFARLESFHFLSGITQRLGLSSQCYLSPPPLTEPQSGGGGGGKSSSCVLAIPQNGFAWKLGNHPSTRAWRALEIRATPRSPSFCDLCLKSPYRSSQCLASPRESQHSSIPRRLGGERPSLGNRQIQSGIQCPSVSSLPRILPHPKPEEYRAPADSQIVPGLGFCLGTLPTGQGALPTFHIHTEHRSGFTPFLFLSPILLCSALSYIFPFYLLPIQSSKRESPCEFFRRGRSVTLSFWKGKR